MTYELSHILVAQKFAAEDLERKLLAGEEFTKLARQYSICSSAAQSGSLGKVPLHRLDSDFADAARVLQPGQRSGIVRTRFGYHIIFRHAE